MHEYRWNWCIELVGYGYSIVVGTIFVLPIMALMWKNLQKEYPFYYRVSPSFWQSAILGILERILFIISLQMELPVFIGIWFTLKTVSLAKSWEEENTGRHIFNNFLIGNAISILFALASFAFIKYCESKEHWIILLGPVLLSIAILLGLSILNVTLVEKPPKVGSRISKKNRHR